MNRSIAVLLVVTMAAVLAACQMGGIKTEEPVPIDEPERPEAPDQLVDQIVFVRDLANVDQATEACSGHDLIEYFVFNEDGSITVAFLSLPYEQRVNWRWTYVAETEGTKGTVDMLSDEGIGRRFTLTFATSYSGTFDAGIADVNRAYEVCAYSGVFSIFDAPPHDTSDWPLLTPHPNPDLEGLATPDVQTERAYIEFVNHLDEPEPVQLIWLNFQGDLVLLAEIQPGQSHVMYSFVDHLLVARAFSGHEILYVAREPGKWRAEIRK